MPAALVTGGAKRLGRAIVLSLAEAGYDIALHYRSSHRDAESAADAVYTLGRTCQLFRCDFNDQKNVDTLIPRVAEVFPDCRVLINSASIFERASLVKTDSDQFDRHVQINLKVPVFLTQAFARYFGHGHVINMLDTKVARTVTHYFVYTLTKKALADFTKMAARELGPDIRVNGVSPGIILPSLYHSDLDHQRMAKRLPLKRKGEPDHIVNAIRFLLQNDYITGANLFVDGGEHLDPIGD